MKKHIKLILIAAVALILLGGALFGYLKYREYYNANYIVIDDTEYNRNDISLDLSGNSITEFEKLLELTSLENLNLRDTGITIAQYEALTAALPQCTISWSVPFQESYVDSDIPELIISTIHAEDLDALDYLPQLTAVKVQTLSDYSIIEKMQTRYPNVEFFYTVDVGGKLYSNSTTTMNLSGITAQELTEKLAYLPAVTTVNIIDQAPSIEEMQQVRQIYPDIIFSYDFEVFGVTANSTDEFLDLSEIKISSTEEIDAIMPLFYNLTKVDMIHCGPSNEEMEALNNRYPDTLFVWTVKIRWMELRTDITEFMPVKYNMWVNNASCRDLRYFTELIALDLGHMEITRCDFVAYMPKLKYLILADSELADLTPLTGLTNLVFLELFICPFKDYTPLTTLTGLEDLNIAYTYGDPSIITQMTWLKRLWFPQTRGIAMSEEEKQALIDALPNTEICFESKSATGAGWRFGQHYYDMRDIFGMKYMFS